MRTASLPILREAVPLPCRLSAFATLRRVEPRAADARPAARAANRRFAYILVETAIGIAINAAVNLAVAAATFHAAAFIPILGAGGLLSSLLPQTVMGAFMSVLVPLLLTHRRRQRGGLAGFGTDGDSFVRAVMIAASAAAAFTALALPSLTVALPWLYGGSIGFRDLLASEAAYGAATAAIVTPLALRLALPARSQ